MRILSKEDLFLTEIRFESSNVKHCKEFQKKNRVECTIGPFILKNEIRVKSIQPMSSVGRQCEPLTF